MSIPVAPPSSRYGHHTFRQLTIGDGYESRLTVKVVNGMIVAGEETSALAVYDLNGRLIAEGAGNTVAAPATPGVYVVRAVAGSAVKTAKLIVR